LETVREAINTLEDYEEVMAPPEIA